MPVLYNQEFCSFLWFRQFFYFSKKNLAVKSWVLTHVLTSKPAIPYAVNRTLLLQS